jgi:hypothetical protein
MITRLFAAGFLRHLAATPPLYVIFWTGLGLASVVAMFAMRKRWGRIHALHRCAALSLLVHVVLVSLAMTIRLVAAGDGAGYGNGPPIHVRLVDDAGGGGGALASVLPPPSLADVVSERPPADTKAVREVAAATKSPPQDPSAASKTTPVEAPELLPPSVEPPKSSPIAEDAPAPEHTSESALAATQQSAGEGSTSSKSSANAEQTPATTSATDREQPGDSAAGAGSGMAGAGGGGTNPYARRGGGSDRLRWAEEGGGSRETEAAVDAALVWLSHTQSADGRWDASQFGAGKEMVVLGQDRGGTGADADTGITALALLAFLGAGDTHHTGDYQATVRKGLEFLVRGQDGDGNLGGEAGLYARMYCHSMATFAIAEALAMTGDPALRPPAERGVSFCLRAQNPSTGGWRYRPGDMGDTSQLGWQLMALWSAERAGINVPPPTWTGAERFLRSVRRGQAGGLASYRADSPVSTSMTAEALYCRQLVGETLGGADDAAAASEATQQLLRTLPEPSRVNLYYWYYGSLALHRQQQLTDQNGLAWQTWNNAMSGVLVNKQTRDGAEAGSWDPECIWGGYGGRVYSTALSTLCLEVYYRYAPAASAQDWTATQTTPTQTTK